MIVLIFVTCRLFYVYIDYIGHVLQQTENWYLYQQLKFLIFIGWSSMFESGGVGGWGEVGGG